MAIDPFGKLLQTRIQMDELQRQRRLDEERRQQNALANRLSQQQSFRPRAFQPVPVTGPGGEVSLVGPSFSANDASWNVVPLQLPEGYSYLRETPEQERIGAVEKKRAELAAETEAAGGREFQKVAGKTRAERVSGQIDTGFEAASAIPIIKRSLELLDQVETGGIDRALIGAKQFLGVESADEAELAQNMGKAVLKQLKPTFGAQFTVAEGRELKGIEGGLGKSTEGNKRLLTRALEIYENGIKRGMRAAELSGDTAAYNELRDALSYNVQQAPPAKSGLKTVTTQAQYDALPSGAIYIEDGVQYRKP